MTEPRVIRELRERPELCLVDGEPVHFVVHVDEILDAYDTLRAARDAALALAKSECDNNDTLRTQLAAARGERVAALATMQKIGAQKNAWIKRATDAEKRILSLLTAALSEGTP